MDTNAILVLIGIIAIVAVIIASKIMVPKIRYYQRAMANGSTCHINIYDENCSDEDLAIFCTANVSNVQCREYCLERTGSSGYKFASNSQYDFCTNLVCDNYLPELKDTLLCNCDLTNASTLATCSQNFCGSSTCLHSDIKWRADGNPCNGLTATPYKITNVATTQLLAVKPWNVTPSQTFYEYGLNSVLPLMPIVTTSWVGGDTDTGFLNNAEYRRDVYIEGDQLLKNRWAPNYANLSCVIEDGQVTTNEKANTGGEYQWLVTPFEIPQVWDITSAERQNIQQFGYCISYSHYYPYCFNYVGQTGNFGVNMVGSFDENTGKYKFDEIANSDVLSNADKAGKFCWIVIPIRSFEENNLPIIIARIYPFIQPAVVDKRKFDFSVLAKSVHDMVCLTESGTNLTFSLVNGTDSQLWRFEPYNISCQAGAMAIPIFTRSLYILSPGCFSPPITVDGKKEFELLVDDSDSMVKGSLFDNSQVLMVIRAVCVHNDNGNNIQFSASNYLFAQFQEGQNPDGTNTDVNQMMFGISGNSMNSRDVAIGWDGYGDFGSAKRKRYCSQYRVGVTRVKCNGYKNICVWTIINKDAMGRLPVTFISDVMAIDLYVKSYFFNYAKGATQRDCLDLDENFSFLHFRAYPVAIYNRSEEPVEYIHQSEFVNGNMFRLYLVRSCTYKNWVGSQNNWEDNGWDYTTFGWLKTAPSASTGNPTCLNDKCEDVQKEWNSLLPPDNNNEAYENDPNYEYDDTEECWKRNQLQACAPDQIPIDDNGNLLCCDIDEDETVEELCPSICEPSSSWYIEPSKDCTKKCKDCQGGDSCEVDVDNTNVVVNPCPFPHDTTDADEMYDINRWCDTVGQTAYDQCTTNAAKECGAALSLSVLLTSNMQESTPYEFFGLSNENVVKDNHGETDGPQGYLTREKLLEDEEYTVPVYACVDAKGNDCFSTYYENAIECTADDLRECKN